MADPVTLGLVIAGASAATSVAGARAQNKAVSRSSDAQNEAANEQAKQIREAADVRREQRIRESTLARGRIAASAGARGVGLSGSLAALERQVESDTAINLQLLGRNEANQIGRVQSGLNANLASLDAQRQSPILSLFSGAASGFQTGLSIGNSMEAAK